MLPQETRLYTWIDVEDVIIRVRDEKKWPSWLKSAQAYWDELTLEIDKGKKEKAVKWLADIFEPRFEKTDDDTDGYIILESIENSQNKLEIIIDETEEKPVKRRFLPVFNRHITISKEIIRPETENFAPDCPPIIALHSFKGGVGRTLLAIAIASAIKEQNSNNQVLLIDADLEAPGISFMLKRRMPDPEISFADVLALIHSDHDPKSKKSLELIADKIKKRHRLGGIYILPAFRSQNQFTSLQIKPEHLIQDPNNPFIITNAISGLGKLLKVKAVVVDLRAGISEFSSGFLLDHRVNRISVTTLSPQSLEGTAYLLDLLQELAPPAPDYPLPKIIISQIPDIFIKNSDLIIKQLEETENLKKSLEKLWNENELSAKEILKHKNVILTPQEESLTVPPQLWDEMVNKISGSELFSKIKNSSNWFGLHEDSIPTLSELKKQRKKLFDLTESMLNMEPETFSYLFNIKPVENFINDFSNTLPVVVIAGETGTGKTSAFLSLLKKTVQVGTDHCFPVIYSQSFKENSIELIKHAEKEVLSALKWKKTDFDYNSLLKELFLYLEKSLERDISQEEWRKIWMDFIAQRMGFNMENQVRGSDFLDYLSENKIKIVALMDGLEDIFSNFLIEQRLKQNVFLILSSEEDFTKKEELYNEKLKRIKKAIVTAFKALVQDIPEWLRQQPEQYLGIIIFLRYDIIKNVMNGGKLPSRYSPYELKWTRSDAVNFCQWIYKKYSLSKTNWDKSLSEFIEDLSDSQDNVKPLDIVRFFNMAAEESLEDNKWQKSLLTPEAIEKSVKEYFMKLTPDQESKLKKISDDLLYEEAKKFIDKNGTIKNAQMSGLENAANTAKKYYDVIKFINHQAGKNNPEISSFYKVLSKQMERIIKEIKDDRDFIPENLTRKQLKEYTEYFGLLFAREFIHHLSSENRYQSEDD